MQKRTKTDRVAAFLAARGREWEIIGFAARLMQDAMLADYEARKARKEGKTARANNREGANEGILGAVHAFGALHGIRIGRFCLAPDQTDLPAEKRAIVGGDRCPICDWGNTRFATCLHDLKEG